MIPNVDLESSGPCHCGVNKGMGEQEWQILNTWSHWILTTAFRISYHYHLHCIQGFQPQSYGHLGLDHSLLCVCVGETALCTVGYLPISLASTQGFPGGASGRELACQCGRFRRHWSGGSPGGGHSNPMQYSCLENPMDGGADRLQSMGSHRVRHNWSDLACTRWPLPTRHQ